MADYVSLVEPRLGTTQTRWIAFSSACRPFGMVNVSPDTRINGDWGCGYYYPDRDILGISHLHEWQISGLLVMPVAGEVISPAGGPETWTSPFSHDDEIARPGYHRFHLQRYGVTAELTATDHVALHRYTFSRSHEHAGLVIDLASTLGPSDMGAASLTRVAADRFEGFLTNQPTIRRPKPLRVYFAIHVDRACQLAVPSDASQPLRAMLCFGDVARRVVIKVGISYTSVAAAWHNLVAETADRFDFDAVRQATQDHWNAMLGRAKVEGGTPSRRARFYTDLFFAILGRRNVSDVTGTYIDNTGREPVVRQIPLDASGRPAYRHFNSDSFWGAQWSITPLWSLLYPEIIDEFCRCFMDIYRNGGLIPRGPAGGNYTFVMTSAQTTPLFVHAMLAGIYRPEDSEEVYRALRKNHMPGGLMSRAGYEHNSCRGGGIDDYIQLGYIPEDLPRVGFHVNGAAQTLEHAYNDWCLAQLAASLGHSDDAALFTARSRNYANLFDASIGMMRPRNRDGSWLEPYDPFSNRGWTEAGGWSYTFYVPHDVPGLISAFGSRERFLAQLEHCMELSESKGFKAPHGKHEQSALDFGNEPALAVAHLFHVAGEPQRTQYWLRRILDTLKSGNSPLDGYGGDEDQGMMGAWNALVAMGLFTVDGGCSRDPDLLITTPVFDRVELHVPGRETPLVIEKQTPGEEAAIYITAAKYNGRSMSRDLRLLHREIRQGGTLSLDTSATRPG